MTIRTCPPSQNCYIQCCQMGVHLRMHDGATYTSACRNLLYSWMCLSHFAFLQLFRILRTFCDLHPLLYSSQVRHSVLGQFLISTLQSTGICHNRQKKTVQCVLKYPPMEGFSAILFTHSQQLCRYSYPITLWPIAPIHNCGTNWCVDGILTHVGIDVIWILIRRNSTCLLL